MFADHGGCLKVLLHVARDPPLGEQLLVTQTKFGR